MIAHCFHCGSRLTHKRQGVRLRPRQVQVFDLAKRNMPLPEICESLGMNANTLRVHVSRINERIAAKGFRIAARDGVYQILRMGAI